VVALFLFIDTEIFDCYSEKKLKMTDLAYVVNQMKCCKTPEDMTRAKNRLERRRIAYKKCVVKAMTSKTKRYKLSHYILKNLTTFFGVFK
jgi:hypothetical protein